MPIFEYECRKCRHVFEALLRSAAAPAPACPKCGAAKPARQLSVFSAAMGRPAEPTPCASCPGASGRRSPCAGGACPMRER